MGLFDRKEERVEEMPLDWKKYGPTEVYCKTKNERPDIKPDSQGLFNVVIVAEHTDGSTKKTPCTGSPIDIAAAEAKARKTPGYKSSTIYEQH